MSSFSMVLVFCLLTHVCGLRVPLNQAKSDEVADGDVKSWNCFDDMCVDMTLPNVFDLDESNETYEEFGKVESSTRILLNGLVPAYHGSTALEMAFMSSKEVSTLCAADVWQCEANNIMQRKGVTKNALEWNWDQALDVFAQTWDLSRHVLFYKNADTRDIWGATSIHEKVQAAALPAKFQQHGIKSIELVYVLMWRPICLCKLSSHCDPMKKEDQGREVNDLESIVQAHSFFMSRNQRVLLVNFADLIWRPNHSLNRISANIGELGKLDPEFVPKDNKDVYPGNKWKCKESLASFGRKIHPMEFQYSLEDASCQSGLDKLEPDMRARADAAVEYLRLHSK